MWEVTCVHELVFLILLLIQVLFLTWNSHSLAVTHLQIEISTRRIAVNLVDIT